MRKREKLSYQNRDIAPLMNFGSMCLSIFASILIKVKLLCTDFKQSRITYKARLYKRKLKNNAI